MRQRLKNPEVTPEALLLRLEGHWAYGHGQSPSAQLRGGSRLSVHHPELLTLAIAHVDCDAFYASVEKHDRPERAARPLIVGGGKRGVVTTACYIARLSGVRSAMPMFKATKLCPDAVIIKPDIANYAAESRRIRALMRDLTPLVEPLSIDEATHDLSSTEALHRVSQPGTNPGSSRSSHP